MWLFKTFPSSKLLSLNTPIFKNGRTLPVWLLVCPSGGPKEGVLECLSHSECPCNYFEMKHSNDRLGSVPSERLIPRLWINLKSEGVQLCLARDGCCRRQIKNDARRFIAITQHDLQTRSCWSILGQGGGSGRGKLVEMKGSYLSFDYQNIWRYGVTGFQAKTLILKGIERE